MKIKLPDVFCLTACFMLLGFNTRAQNCIPTNINGAVVNFGCNQPCSTIVFQIPHLKGTDDYAVNSIPYAAYPYTNATGVPLTTTYIDDKFSPLFNLTFPFCFYGAIYNTLVIGSNGVVTFDPICANQSNAYTLTSPGNLPQPLPYNVGAAPSGIGTTYYPRASIMGAYHDIDPSANPLPTRRIEYNIIGTAPCRKLVISYFDIRMFSCTNLICSQQIVLHESTGIVEIFLLNKPLCPGWNQGLAILGMQDFTRTKWVAAPGKNCTQWSESNTGYSFVPSGSGSRFLSSELLSMSGTLLVTADTATTTPGLLDLTFNNFCPAAGNGQYVVKTTFSSCDNPGTQLISLDTFTINRVNNLAAVPTTTATICNGAVDGTITVTPTSGLGPFTYTLDGILVGSFPSAHTFNNVSAGPHVVTITDANNCTLTFNVTVAAGPALTTTVSKTDALCNGSIGTITVTPPTIGTPPYSYSLDGVSWQSSNIFNGLAAGTYTVYYRSSDICPGNSSVTINEPSGLSANSFNRNGTCNGGPDGAITVSASGGAPGYQYSINGTSYQSSNVFNVLPGNYTISVKDNNGCITTFPTTVALTNDLTFAPQTDEIICEGTSKQLSLTSNAIQYTWSPGTGLSSTSIYNPVANPVTTTQYKVRAQLGLCFIEDTVMVRVNAAPIPNAGVDGFICFGQTYQLNASGGTQYSWSPTNYLNNPVSANPISTPTKDVTYTLSILSDANGCASLITDQIRIDVTPPIKVRTFPFDTVAHAADQIQLLAIPSDSDVINYVWIPTTGLSDPKIANPVATAGVVGDVAQYKVITSTIAGCKGEGFITIRVYKGPDIYVPTGFTPNGDGKNDKFTPFPVGMKNYNYFRVYNRWGQLVFSSPVLHDGWDGKLGGRDQPSGTYVWMIEGISKDDKIIIKKGTITLIR